MYRYVNTHAVLWYINCYSEINVLIAKMNILLKTCEEIPIKGKFNSGLELLTVKNYSVNIEVKNI
jgi:hypothetical protein